KCCHVPGRSTNRTSTTSTPSAFARSSTSRGEVLLPAFVSIAMYTLQEISKLALTGLKVIVGSDLGADHGEPARNQGPDFCVVGTTAGGLRRALLVCRARGGRRELCSDRTFWGAPAGP